MPEAAPARAGRRSTISSAARDRHDVVVRDPVDELVERVDAGLARRLVDDDLDGLAGLVDASLLERQQPALGRRAVGLVAEHADVDPVVDGLRGLLPLAVGAELRRGDLEIDDVLAVVALLPRRL